MMISGFFGTALSPGKGAFRNRKNSSSIFGGFRVSGRSGADFPRIEIFGQMVLHVKEFLLKIEEALLIPNDFVT